MAAAVLNLSGKFRVTLSFVKADLLPVAGHGRG
jgi:hypothetical protein